jgi:arylsulfatase A-like enzyme
MLVSNYDFMPSVLSYLGLAGLAPAQPRTPGRDFSAVLRGAQPASWDNVIYYEMETTRGIRTDEWKYVARHPNGPFEFYDMRRDPRERFNLYGQPMAARPQAELAARLDAFFTGYADPQYDIWNGGRSKAKRHTQ